MIGPGDAPQGLPSSGMGGRGTLNAPGKSGGADFSLPLHESMSTRCTAVRRSSSRVWTGSPAPDAGGARTCPGGPLALFRELLEELPPERLEVLPGAAGLHLTVRLRRGLDDRRVAARAAELGFETPPLSTHFLGPEPASGLVLGFGVADEDGLGEGVRTLRRVLEEVAAEE